MFVVKENRNYFKQAQDLCFNYLHLYNSHLYNHHLCHLLQVSKLHDYDHLKKKNFYQNGESQNAAKSCCQDKETNKSLGGIENQRIKL